MAIAESSAQLEDRFAVLRDDLEHTLTTLLANLKRRPADSDVVVMRSTQRTQTLLEKLRNRQFQMAVVAMMKAGKSTLINAWLGETILPVANVAETARIVQIRHQSENRPRLVVRDQPAVEGVAAIESYIREANRNAREGGFAQEHEEFVLHAPFVALRGRPVERYGFLLLDTPGPNEAGGAEPLRDAVNRVLHDSDVLVYVLDYTHMKSEDEDRFLSRMKQRAGLLQQRASSLFVVVNKFDQKNRTGMTADETRLYVVNLLSPIVKLAPDRIFVVSAERALLARLVAAEKAAPEALEDFKRKEFGESFADRDDIDGAALTLAAEAMLRRSSVSALEQAVIASLYQNSARVLFEGVIADAEEILDSLENYARTQKATLSTSVADSRAQAKRLRDDIDKIRGQLQQLSTVVTAVESDISIWVEGEFKAFRKTVEQTIDDAFSGKPLPSNNLLRRFRDFLVKVATASSDVKEVQINTRRLNEYIAEYVEASWRDFRNRLEDQAYDQQKHLFRYVSSAAQPLVEQIEASVGKHLGVKLRPSRVRMPERTMGELRDDIESVLSDFIETKRESRRQKAGTESVRVKKGGFCSSDEYEVQDVYKTTYVDTARASVDAMKKFWSDKLSHMTTASVLAARAVVVDRVRDAVNDVQSRVNDLATEYIETVEDSIARAEKSAEARSTGIANADALLRDLDALRGNVDDSRIFLDAATEMRA